MLPQILAGRYQRYKEDTTVFTIWLSKAAIVCGYQTPWALSQYRTDPEKQENQGSATKLENRARKEAREAAKASKETASNSSNIEPPPSVTKYEITTSELLKQADAIAASQKAGIEIPESIVRVVQRAINARRRCAAWFQQTGVHDEDGSTARHVHFIGVLEKALSVLLPSARANPSPPKPKEATSTLEEPSHQLANRFGALDVEDLDESLDVAASQVVVTKKKPADFRSVDVYELESQWEDHAFVIFCFFEDLHRLQSALKETWESYKAGTCDLVLQGTTRLVVASVITNLAFSLVRRDEDEIISPNPKIFSKPDSYDALASEIFYSESFRNGEDPDAKLASNESLRITPFDEFMYLPTARTLVKFRQYVKSGLVYPQPVQPLRTNYIFRLELLELPETKQMEKDHLFLSQLLIDWSLNCTIRDNLSVLARRKLPVEDEFNDGLERLRKAGKISIWIVFASRIIIDVHDLLGKDVERGYDDFRSATQAALKVLDLQVKGNELVPGGNGESWHSRDADLPASLYNFLNFWVLRGPLPSLKALYLQQLSGRPTVIHEMPQDVREQALKEMLATGFGFHNDDVLSEHSVKLEKMDLKPIKPDKDSNFLYANNPLYGGTLKFNPAFDMEKAGITLANHHLTIFAMAHLYNISRQTKINQGEWPELDRIKKLHIGQLFSGQLPTRPSECHTRLSIRMGPTANASARNQSERAFKNQRAQ